MLAALLAVSDDRLIRMDDAFGCDCTPATPERLRRWQAVSALRDLKALTEADVAAMLAVA